MLSSSLLILYPVSPRATKPETMMAHKQSSNYRRSYWIEVPSLKVSVFTNLPPTLKTKISHALLEHDYNLDISSLLSMPDCSI